MLQMVEVTLPLSVVQPARNWQFSFGTMPRTVLLPQNFGLPSLVKIAKKLWCKSAGLG
jgi:hypothetical protein